MSSPRMIPRGSIGYTTVPLLVQIRLILASIVEVPSGREIWRERAAILIKEITSFHSHLSCCIHTTNGGSFGIVGRQSYARSIWLSNITGVHVSTDLYFERNSYWPFL